MEAPEQTRVMIAAGVSAACCIAFTFLATVVSVSNSLQVDESVQSWVGEHRVDGVTSAMRIVTWLGSAAVLYPATILLALWWWRRERDRRSGAFLAVAAGGSTALYTIFKALIERPRPPADEAVGTYPYWAFPSGHATQSMSFFAMLLVLVWFARRPRLRLWTIAATLIVLTVGASRIYLGAHWLTDVLGGYALGGAWVSLMVVVGLTTRWMRISPQPR